MNRALYAHKTALRLKQHLDHMSLRVSIFNNQEGELGENSWLEDGAGGPTSPEDLASHPGTSGDSRQTYAFAPYPYSFAPSAVVTEAGHDRFISWQSCRCSPSVCTTHRSPWRQLWETESASTD